MNPNEKKRKKDRIENFKDRIDDLRHEGGFFFEERTQYKSGDYVAPLILPRIVRAMVKRKAFRRLLQRIIPKGLYEYGIAGTIYFDSIFENPVQDGFEQTERLLL